MNGKRILLLIGIFIFLNGCSSHDSSTAPSSSTTTTTTPTSNLPQFYQDAYATQATYYTSSTGYDNGACSFGAPANTNITAINTALYNNAALCGAYIEVTGDKGTVTVKVIDVCSGSPICDSNHLDLSADAYNAVTTVAGITNVTWKFVQAPVGTNPIKIYWGNTLTPYFMDLVVDVHRHPVASVEIQDSSGTFISGTRTVNNHFQFTPSSGNTFLSSFDIRITDMFGNQVQDTVTWATNSTSTTTVQFPAY